MSETRCFRAPSRPYTSRPPVPPAPRIRLWAPSSGWTQIATPLAPSWAVGAVSPAEATVATAGPASGAGAFCEQAARAAVRAISQARWVIGNPCGLDEMK